MNTGALLRATVNVVTAHVSKSNLEVSELPSLIRDVYRSLASVEKQRQRATMPTPAVPISKSITANYIVCLEDGLKMKMLKRHLMSAYGMTPDDYRKRWGLPNDYPMVAPNYAKKRREMAQNMGLGRRSRKQK